ncbi:hypothetical protein G1K37_10890 [Tenacibaculum dicentrarchi]|nr:hypothetical protein [Tenacibaculum dicentrarchi]MCG8838856.1 hypothetical protein [Tenacibaculum dicentrarchi]
MEIVTSKNILLEYFDLLVPKQKTETEKSLQATIENNNNKIKLSSDYLELLESFFLEKGNHYLEFFQTFVTNCFAENRIISFTSTKTSKDENDIIINCFEHDFNDYSFYISKKVNQKIKNSLTTNICTLENVQKPNQDWLILNILSGNVIDLDYSNFSNQRVLSDFIGLIPSLSKKTEQIEIIDSYFNMGNHNLVYENLKSSKSKVKCFTRISNSENKTLKRKLIKDYFGKRKTSVSFSRDTKITHERKIRIGNLVIEFTHDFAEIKPQNRNWTIYLKICDLKTELFKENTSKYNAT